MVPDLSAMFRALFILFLLILLIVGICLFFIGRCTAQHNVRFQSPITTEAPK
jgi:uncharacterized protein YneF (UPF0154 family)